MAKVFSVSSAQELMNALAIAKGGDTVELAGGDYGKLDLQSAKTFGVKAIYDSAVTIVSANPEEPASFSGMDLRGVENLTFDSVIFDSAYTGGEVWVSPFSIKDSSGITIRNSTFEGELASGTGDPAKDGFATGKALTVSGGSNISIEHNEFHTWHRAIVIGGSENISISDNEVHSIRSDGMNFSNVQNVVIADNYIHDFITSTESGDHADMIQFWTNGTSSPSTNITISGNTLDVGEGGTTQSIFMRNDMVDRGLAGEEMYYRNILIEENIIFNNHAHGITVGETDGLIIRKNTVLDASTSLTSSVATPKIIVSAESNNVSIQKNATAEISGYASQSDWTLSGNAFVQNADREGLGYYESEFLNSSMNGEAADLIVDTSGIIARMEAGASRLFLNTTPDAIRPAFDIWSDPSATNTVIFDARYTYGPMGEVKDTEAQFVWDFGDGSTAIGKVVRHSYADAGLYDATLTLLTPDGTPTKAASEVGIMGADLLSFNSQTGFFQGEGYGASVSIDGSDKASISSAGVQGVNLGDTGVQVGIGENYLSRLFGASSFDMSLTLRADTLGSMGEIARVHGNFVLSVAARGELKLELTTDSEGTSLFTTGVTVNDGVDHDIRISFDGVANNLTIHVDDQLVGATEIEGGMRTDYPRALIFGNPWGKVNFDGTLTAFDLEVRNQDYPAYEGDASALSDSVLPEDTAQGASDLLIPETTDGDATVDAPAPEEGGNTLEKGDTQTAPPPSQVPAEQPTDYEPNFPKSPLYRADFAEADAIESGIKMIGDAHIVHDDNGTARVVLDGQKDHVALGRVETLEDSQQLNVSLDFQRSDVESGTERMIWNHMKFGVALQDDTLIIHAANTDQAFHKGFKIKNAGIDDTEKHSLNVAIDATTDRLQVVLDGEVVLDERDTDFDFVGAGGNEWGWSIGTAWNRYYEGSVSDFELDDQVIFVDDASMLV